jgi:hypothetical protein
MDDDLRDLLDPAHDDRVAAALLKVRRDLVVPPDDLARARHRRERRALLGRPRVPGALPRLAAVAGVAAAAVAVSLAPTPTWLSPVPAGQEGSEPEVEVPAVDPTRDTADLVPTIPAGPASDLLAPHPLLRALVATWDRPEAAARAGDHAPRSGDRRSPRATEPRPTPPPTPVDPGARGDAARSGAGPDRAPVRPDTPAPARPDDAPHRGGDGPPAAGNDGPREGRGSGAGGSGAGGPSSGDRGGAGRGAGAGQGDAEAGSSSDRGNGTGEGARDEERAPSAHDDGTAPPDGPDGR